MTFTLQFSSLQDGEVFDCPVEYLSQCPYDPRLGANPKEEEIKLDLSVNGFNSTFDVTLEPGSQSLIPRGSGNTRVKLFHELYRAGDMRFTTIPCKFHVWPGKAEKISAGVRYNNNQGNMGFISEAVSAIKYLREAHANEFDNLSTRLRCEMLKKTGWTVTRQKQTLFEFLDTHLLNYEVVSMLMLDKAVVDLYSQSDVKALHDIFKALSVAYENHKISIFNDAWVEALHAVEPDSFSEPARLKLSLSNYLEKKLSDLSGININDVKAATDANIANNPNSSIKPSTFNERKQNNDLINKIQDKIIGSTDSFSEFSEKSTPLITFEKVFLTASLLATEVGIEDLVGRIDGIFGFDLILPSEPLTKLEQSRVWWFLLYMSGIAQDVNFEVIRDPQLKQSLVSGDLTNVIALCGKKLNLSQYLALMTETDEMLVGTQVLMARLLAELRLLKERINVGKGD